MTTERMPPQNLEIERSLLCAALISTGEAVDDVASIVKPEMFYSDAHRTIWEVITGLIAKNLPTDAEIVGEHLNRAGKLNEIGGAEYLMDLLGVVSHAGHADYYGEIVRGHWVRRRTIEACTRGMVRAWDANEGEDPTEILETVAASLGMVDDTLRPKSGATLDESLAEFLEAKQSDGIQAYSTGFEGLDQLTGGFPEGSLTIVGARPSMGKTAWALNVSQRMIEAGTGVVFFSLEQSRVELTSRLLGIVSGISAYRIHRENLREDETQQLIVEAARMNDWPLWIEQDRDKTVARMASDLRRAKRQMDIRVVVIDYLQLIEPDDRRVHREQQVAAITRNLKKLAGAEHVAVICLAQLNREVERRDDKRPKLSDLRESGSIEQDADLVLMLHRPEMFDPEDNPGQAEVIIRKQRNGGLGTAYLDFQKSTMRFDDVNDDFTDYDSVHSQLSLYEGDAE